MSAANELGSERAPLRKDVLVKRLFVVLAFLAAHRAYADDGPAAAADDSTGQVYLKIGEANVRKSLLALPALQNQGSSSAAALRAGKDLFDVVANDLSASGYFEFVRPGAFLEDVAKVGLKPAPTEANGFKFDTWKQIGAEFLIRAGYRLIDGKLTLEAYVYDVPQQKLVLGKSYKADAADVRTMAHTFGNDLVKALTGKRGFFLSRIVASRATQPQQKEIYVLDWDGANARQVTNHKSIAISPAWAPDALSVVYTAFAYHANEKKRNADLFQFDLATGKRWLLSYRPGINSGAHFFPDGKGLALTISQSGNPDIFRMTLDGKSLTRITDGPRGAINVEPSISPDGKRIAFSSDRSGQPMIYVMNLDGSNMKRVTFAGQFNSSPAWSPDGKRIAFAGFDAGHFDLFAMDSDGVNMARLTSSKKPGGKFSNNESPSFSPDGRLILFASDRTGVSQLFVVTTDGTTERRITFDQHAYFKPQWSPYLD